MTLRANAILLQLLLLSIAACSGPPEVLLDTPTGVTPIYTPTPQAAMPGGAIAPPPGMMPPPPVLTGSRNGSYTGTAFPLETGGGLCISTLTVSGFHVNGNAVRFGGFRGRIDPNNGLQMIYGNRWIVGQFEGPTFHGQLDVTGSFGAPGCTYMLNLQRTAAR
ncbi:MAG TPA: hypothetical protein VL614_11700 [Acetobacteraceae bacterium]|jgi:hypothetical protein|nr:hypothetical protein [Acetobacteraceae bacterium]